MGVARRVAGTRQGHRFAHVAVADVAQELCQGFVAQLQQAVPEIALQRIDGPGLLGRLSDHRLQSGDLLLQCFVLENVVRVRHAHGGPPCV